MASSKRSGKKPIGIHALVVGSAVMCVFMIGVAVGASFAMSVFPKTASVPTNTTNTNKTARVYVNRDYGFTWQLPEGVAVEEDKASGVVEAKQVVGGWLYTPISIAAFNTKESVDEVYSRLKALHEKALKEETEWTESSNDGHAGIGAHVVEKISFAGQEAVLEITGLQESSSTVYVPSHQLVMSMSSLPEALKGPLQGFTWLNQDRVIAKPFGVTVVCPAQLVCRFSEVPHISQMGTEYGYDMTDGENRGVRGFISQKTSEANAARKEEFLNSGYFKVKHRETVLFGNGTGEVFIVGSGGEMSDRGEVFFDDGISASFEFSGMVDNRYITPEMIKKILGE